MDSPFASGQLVWSVQGFGAVGNGVADDTAAIQAAIDSGYPLLFPPGVYVIAGTLTKSQSNVGWRGINATLKKTGTGTLLRVGGSGSTRMDTIAFEGLTFKGGSGVGVDIVDSNPASQQGIVFRDCRFIGFKSGAAKPANDAVTQGDYSRAWYKGYQLADFQAQTDTAQVRLDGGIGCRMGSTVWTVRFENCYFEDNNVGFVAVGGLASDYIRFVGTTIISCGAAAVIAASNNVTFRECTIEFNYSGLWAYGVRHFKVTDCQMEGNELHHVYMGAASTPRCRVAGLDFVNFQPKGGNAATQVNAVYAPAVDTLYVRGCSFNGVTTQTPEKGWDLFFGADTYRVHLQGDYESSDGATQINSTTRVVESWRKSTSGATCAINGTLQ